MSCDTARMVLALTESFGSIERPDFDDPKRLRLWTRADEAIAVVPDRLRSGGDASKELNVIVHVTGLLGGADAGTVRCLAATLGASLGVRFPMLAA